MYWWQPGTEVNVRYPIKTPSQLPLVLKGFRKACGLTQAAMAQRLGVTQQSYAYFEANPASATLERLFVVMRLLGVEIALDQMDSLTTVPRTAKGTFVSTSVVAEKASTVKIAGKARAKKAHATIVTGKVPPTTVSRPGRIIPSARKKEIW